MKSSWYFQGYVEGRNSIFLTFKFPFLVCLPLINFIYTANNSTSLIIMLPREFQSISRLAMHADWLLFISSVLKVTSSILAALTNFKLPFLQSFFARRTPFCLWILHPQYQMFFMWSAYLKKVVRLGKILWQSLFLHSRQLSGAKARETITISSVTSPEPQIVTVESDSNEPTIPYGFGS